MVGIKANKEKMAHNLHNSLMLVTALSPYIGYDKCAQVAKLAFKDNVSLKEAVLKLGFMEEKEFDKCSIRRRWYKKGVWKNPHPGCRSRATSREPKGAVKKSSTAPLFRLRQLAW